MGRVHDTGPSATDLTERIERRRTRRSRNELIVDRDSLNPAVHPSKPVGREALFETLLNAIDPLFDRAVPPNTYVWGPGGAGKSATVTALLSALDAEIGGTEPYYTETLRERIDAAAPKSETLPVAVDHVGEPTIVDLADLHAFFEPFGSLARIGVGRTPPGELSVPPAEQQLHVPAYPRELVDVLTVRGSRRLSHTLDHGHARRIAEWAGGDVTTDSPGDLVVASMDREFDYDDLSLALRTLDDDAVPFLATNPDRTCPTESGAVPDAAGMIGAIEGVTGRTVDEVPGKPSPRMVERTLEPGGVDPVPCLMVSDRIETDVLMGDRAGMTTVLVVSGVADREAILDTATDPDYVVDSIVDVGSVLAGR